MRILFIGHEKEINSALGMISDKYIYSEEDVIETCIWNDAVSVYKLIVHNETVYDWYIVIGSQEKQSEEICYLLTTAFNISSEKIIDYYLFYNTTKPFMHIDTMLGIPNTHYDGLVLGISHAEVGIIPELLNGSYVNLSVSSQDIFFNYKSLEYCMAKFPEKIKGLNHLIIDLFDYTYFNYDISKSRMYVPYLGWGGFNKDKHNFDLNKNYNYKFEDIVNALLEERYKGITDSKIDFWADLFGDIHNKDYYKGYTVPDRISFRNRVVTDKDVEEYKVETPIVVKHFSETIEENIQLFIKLIELARTINPDIRISCILLPRYAKAQEKAEYIYSKWREEFYEIIKSVRDKYEFEFIDFKKSEIANHPEYFYDISHLNYAGAMVFSKILADTLQLNS